MKAGEKRKRDPKYGKVDMEDCCAVYRQEGAVCCMMDTYCRDTGGGQWDDFERKLLQLYRQALQRNGEEEENPKNGECD